MKAIDSYIRKHPLDCALHYAALFAAVTLVSFINWTSTKAGGLTVAITSATVVTVTVSSLIRAVIKQGKEM